MEKMVTIVKPGEKVDPEFKRYLVLYVGYDEETDEEVQRYEWCEGRRNTVKFILDRIYEINILKSLVIVEDKDISLFDALNVHDFLIVTKQNTRTETGSTLLDQLGYGNINLESLIQADTIQYINEEGGEV